MPAEPPDATGDPVFPPLPGGRLRVSAPGEVGAFLAAWPHPAGAWSAAGSTTFQGAGRTEEHLTLRAPDGSMAVLRVDLASLDADGEDPGEAVDRVMRTALDAARAAGPLHPGAMPRFPLPSPAYPGRVAVPLVLQASDDAGRRGVYGPDRLVVAAWPGGEPEGVGDAPGFDPADWPPRRLGDWPPPALAALPREQVSGSVVRFSALWGRLLNAWFAKAAADPAEAAEALLLLARLEPPGAPAALESISPAFWRWLRGA